jgi:branched-chain amino acid transport system permease protein
MIFGVPTSAFLGQLLIGLINGSFYALVSLGLSIIFGLLQVVNFAHGALYMLGAYVAWALLEYLGIGYWPALVIAPLVVAALGLAIERLMLRRLYGLEHLYALLLTFGLSILFEGALRMKFGTSGQPYPNPITSGVDLEAAYIPGYRLWVIAASLGICGTTWWVIERTKIGSYLRAATENAALVRTFGVSVPRILMLTYALGVGLAGLSGAMAAPIYQVSPHMGTSMITVVFAVVVIGGMGSLVGSIVAGFGLGVLEGLTKLFLPGAAEVVVFVVMILILAVRPYGLFGQELR